MATDRFMQPTTTAETLDCSAGEDAIRERIQACGVGKAGAEPSCSFRIIRAEKLNFLLMRLTGMAKIALDGPLGDFAFAMLDGPEVRITGDTGNALGEGMTGGSLRVNGNAGHAMGLALRGGTLALYGNTGNDCGRHMDGGEIFVRGNAGSCVGAGAISGAIMIAGDAGPGLGDEMLDAVIYVRGTVKSLGRGIVESPIGQKDRLRLGLLMVNAGIRGDAKDFRRYVCWRSLKNSG
jgi:methylamine---glutamate N-methyltransferase subunit B